MSASSAIIRLTLLEALRVRLAWIVAAAILLALGLAAFLDQVALIESRAIQAAVVAATVRFIAAFIVIIFDVTSMVRESSDKVTELLLSQPISRAAYYWAKLAGYVALAVVVGLALSLPLAFTLPGLGLACWVLSLLLELALVAAASLFFVLSLNQVAPAIAAAGGFYLLSRVMDTLQLIAGAQTHSSSLADRTVDGLVSALALLLPSLGRMTNAAWIAQPPPAALLGSLAGQALIYMGLLAGAALFDLYRKNL